MAVTQSDVAKAAGVDRATVTRALNDDWRISEKTKEKVKAAARQLRYRPNHIARSLAMGKSGVVGVVVTPTVLPVFAAIIEPIEASLRKAGYSILFFTTGDFAGERACLEQLLEHQVDGLIAIPGQGEDIRAGYQELLDAGAKVVLLDRGLEGLPVPQIIGDDYLSAKLATEHLLSLGHRNIVHLAMPTTSHAGRERMRGFLETMEEAGVHTSPSSVVTTDFGEEAGARAMSRVLKRKDRPTAVVARHDVVAIGALYAIYEAGLRVPEDISLVGAGDIWCASVLRVPLTTVHHPLRQVSEMGVKLLLDLLGGKDVEPRTHKLPVELVARESCAAVEHVS